MNAIGWNCQGTYNASTVRALRTKIRARHPEVIFLSETKAGELKMQSVVKSLGFSRNHVVGARGKRGGICMLWSYAVTAKVMEYNT